RFTIEQLAGDLLPGATTWQRVATGFHRNTLLNDEAGIDPEEFRVVAVKDRVDATATIWLGTTLECAQCHNHKYDPFSQRDYYRFYAFFNHTADSGVGTGPEIPVPTAAERERMDKIEAEIAPLEEARQARSTQLVKAPEAWEQSFLATSRFETPPPRGLYLHYPLNGGTEMQIPDASGN